jgi:hypothetical protein
MPPQVLNPPIDGRIAMVHRLLTQNSKDSFNRPPDWRWKRAGEILNESNDVRRDYGQDDIATVAAFRSSMMTATTRRHQLGIKNHYPDLYDAYTLYSNDDDRDMRYELEARLLANEPIEVIAGKLALPCGAVVAFEKYFFNVADRLNSAGYITHYVFGRSVQAGLAERQYDLLWKMFGYHCGGDVLDVMVTKFNGPPRPETPEDIRAMWTDDLKDTLRMKAAVAARIMPINFQTYDALLNIYFRMVEAEQDGSTGGGAGHEGMLDNVKRMMDELPWEKRVPGAREIAGDRLSKIEAGGTMFRARELALYTTEAPPDELKALVASARFPEVTHDRTETQPTE